jgi:RNA polymerase sigma-70 factor (ECF subfamily)
MNTDGIDVISELQSGNRKVFEQVFKQYFQMLCFEAKGYIRADYLVEEIVCDVFTRLWMNRHKIKITISLREYLIKSVHNSCIDHYRHQKVQERLKAELGEAQKIYSTLADLDENPLDYIVTVELEERIEKAIDTLPGQYARAFKLSRFNDLSYEEIALEMDISINSVKTNIKNALAILRINLSGFFSFTFLIFSEIFS